MWTFVWRWPPVTSKRTALLSKLKIFDRPRKFAEYFQFLSFAFHVALQCFRKTIFPSCKNIYLISCTTIEDISADKCRSRIFIITAILFFLKLSFRKTLLASENPIKKKLRKCTNMKDLIRKFLYVHCSFVRTHNCIKMKLKIWKPFSANTKII